MNLLEKRIAHHQRLSRHSDWMSPSCYMCVSQDSRYATYFAYTAHLLTLYHIFRHHYTCHSPQKVTDHRHLCRPSESSRRFSTPSRSFERRSLMTKQIEYDSFNYRSECDRHDYYVLDWWCLLSFIMIRLSSDSVPFLCHFKPQTHANQLFCKILRAALYLMNRRLTSRHVGLASNNLATTMQRATIE